MLLSQQSFQPSKSIPAIHHSNPSSSNSSLCIITRSFICFIMHPSIYRFFHVKNHAIDPFSTIFIAPSFSAYPLAARDHPPPLPCPSGTLGKIASNDRYPHIILLLCVCSFYQSLMFFVYGIRHSYGNI